MRFIVFFILLGLGPIVFAQTNAVDLAKPTKVKIIQPAKKKKKVVAKPPVVVPVEVAPPVAAPSQQPIEWGGSVDYNLRTDLADTSKPRLYVHTIDLSYGLSHNPSHTNVGMAIGAAYESVGDRNSEILVNSNEAELFLSDVDLSVDKSFVLVAPFRLMLFLDNEFPTSPDARREGYNSVTSAGLDITGSWFDKHIVGNFKSGYTYIWNSYRYSPATLNLNKQSGWKSSLGLKLKIWGGLYVSGSVGTQLSTYVDGTTDQTYRNGVSLGYAWERITFSASYSNGTYLDESDATIWFVDEYRRTASLRMLFNF